MKSFKRVCVTLIALFYCSVMLAGELQDVVYLKNGSIVRGLIIEQIPNESLKIQTSDGSVFVYEFSQIQKLAKEEEYPNSRSHANRYDRKTFDSFSNTVDRVGYRGFFDIGGSVGVGDFGDGVFSASTSHGYQFNPYFFLGAGLGVDYHFAYETIFMPIFADIRGYFIDGRITPFIGVKIGYSPLDGYGLYFNPTLGVSFGVSKKCALNLSIGYNMQRTEMYSDFYYYTNSPNESISGLSFKLGVEF